MPQIPILLINLDRRPDRLDQMSRKLGALDLTFERVAATDGNEMSDADKKALCPNRFWFGKRYLADAQLGVYRSNLGCLQLGLERGWSRWCILEDDLELHPKFKVCVDQGFPIPTEVHLLKLEALPRKGDTERAMLIKQIEDLSIVLSAFPRAGRGAYIVTRAGARQLVENTSVMTAPNDETLRMYSRTKVFAYELSPSVAWHVREASDIGAGREHAKKKLSRKGWLVDLRWRTARQWTKVSNWMVIASHFRFRAYRMRKFEFWAFQNGVGR